MRILLQLTGKTGLVMHNIRLADKADPIAKEIAAINAKGRNRTEEDYEEIAHLEFLGGLYHDPVVGIHVPSWNIVRCLEDAAKLTRQGANIIRSVIVTTDKVPLDYDGPRKPEELWKQEQFRFRKSVGIMKDKVMRMRPIFPRWGLTFEAELLTDVLDLEKLQAIAAAAGISVGLLDARKLGYGRFGAEIVQ